MQINGKGLEFFFHKTELCVVIVGSLFKRSTGRGIFKEEHFFGYLFPDAFFFKRFSQFNIQCMQAALRVHAHYLDLASELSDLKTAEQFNLHDEFERAGLFALVNAGAAPGVTNMLVQDIAEHFDHLDHVKIRLLEHQDAERFEFLWSVQTTLDDIASPPLVIKKGKPQFVQPLCDEEWFEYPHPFGKHRAYNLYGDELATLPRYIQRCDIDCKSGGSDIEHAVLLSRIGLFSKEPVRINDRCSVSPYELLNHLKFEVPTPHQMKQYVKQGIVKDGFFVAVVCVQGKIKNRSVCLQKSVVFPSLRQALRLCPQTSSYIAYAAGTAAYAFLSPFERVIHAGVLPPEALTMQERRIVARVLRAKAVRITPFKEVRG